jgi:hypothetical protein
LSFLNWKATNLVPVLGNRKSSSPFCRSIRLHGDVFKIPPELMASNPHLRYGSQLGQRKAHMTTCSYDRTPPLNWYPQLPHSLDESYESLRLACSFHLPAPGSIDWTRNPTFVSLNSSERT